MQSSRKTIGTVGSGDLLATGSAYVAVPSDIDRQEYINSCLDTGVVMIRNEQGFTSKAYCNEFNLQQIKWPKNDRVLGSPVVWVKLATQNVPIIGWVFNFKDNRASSTFNEDSKNISTGASSVSVDEEDGVAVLSTKGGISIESKSSSGGLEFFSNNDTNIKTKGKTKLQGFDELILEQVSAEEEVLAYILLKRYGVEISGAAGDLEQAVLGNTLKGLVEELIAEVKSISSNIRLLTVNTAVGPSSVPNNSAAFEANENNLNDINTRLANFLSPNIKID